jgi:4-hydroxybenzoate polyprenyltransferase
MYARIAWAGRFAFVGVLALFVLWLIGRAAGSESLGLTLALAAALVLTGWMITESHRPRPRRKAVLDKNGELSDVGWTYPHLPWMG